MVRARRLRAGFHNALAKSAGRARRIPDFQIFSSGEISKSIFGAARHVRTCARLDKFTSLCSLAHGLTQAAAVAGS
jgi:hypothetical protein